MKYTDLSGEDAVKKVADYNEQGKKAVSAQSHYRDNRSRDYDRRRRDGKRIFNPKFCPFPLMKISFVLSFRS